MATSAADGHAFISYVHEDNARIDKLCALLTTAGIPHWRDREALGPGEEWKTKIRDAIRSDSLAFLACFSANSTTKGKSYQNEELRLAVEEFRMRPPGRTWLIPVRLDECEIPDWDLGAGQRLGDINYIDLFGDQHVENAVKLIEATKKIMGLGAVDAAAVRTSVDEATAAERPVLLRRWTKEMIREPAREIELDDLIAQEVSSILTGMRDDERFPKTLSGGPDQRAKHLLRIGEMSADYWQLVMPFCASLQVAARWGAPETLAPWAKGIRAVSAEAMKPIGGGDALIELRHLPALFTVSVAALAATDQNRWDNFRKLLVDNTINLKQHQGYRASMIVTVNPYKPLIPEMTPAAQALALAARTDQTLSEAIDATQSGAIYSYTPVSDWMFEIFRPLFGDQFPEDADYADAFDRAEVNLGVVNEDLVHEWTGSGSDRPIYLKNKWFGRATWRYAQRQADPIRDFLNGQEQQGADWAPLRAGLFGGSADRARAATDRYIAEFKELSSDRW